MKIHNGEKYIFKNQFFGIRKAEYSKKTFLPAHDHKFIELIYIVSGESNHYIDNCICKLTQGDLLFVGCNQIHSFSTNGAFLCISICIKPEYINETISYAESIYDIFSYYASGFDSDTSKPKEPFISLAPGERMEFENLLISCMTEANIKSPGYEFALNGYIQLIFFKIVRALQKKQSIRITKDITGQIIDYIDKNYTKNLTLSDIAGICFYTPSHIAKAFKKTFGMSLKDYIYTKRVQHAEKLLTETDESIESISIAVGYVNKSQFYKIFKKKKGCTPKQFRDRNKF